MTALLMNVARKTTGSFAKATKWISSMLSRSPLFCDYSMEMPRAPTTGFSELAECVWKK